MSGIQGSGCQAFGRQYEERKDSVSATKNIYFRSDTDIDDLSEILTSSIIPQIGDAYVGASGIQGPQGLVVISRKPYEVSERDKRSYRIRIDYATDSSYTNDWDISISTVKKEYVPWETQTKFGTLDTPLIFLDDRYLGPAGVGGNEGTQGYPPVNRAGDWFNPALKDFRYIRKIVMKKTISAWDQIGKTGIITSLESLLEWEGKINELSVNIAGIIGGPWEFRVDSITARRIPLNSGAYGTELSVVVIHDPKTHATVAANVGYFEKDASGGRVSATAKDGTKSQQPALLDENGKAIREFSAPNITDGPPYYIVFPFPKEADLLDMDLPTGWGM